jgi:DNA-directed RNA polymerase subunit RPC12/RpoP
MTTIGCVNCGFEVDLDSLLTHDIEREQIQCPDCYGTIWSDAFMEIEK